MNDFHDMDEVDRRITDALRAAAGQVDEHSLRPALSPRSNSLAARRHIRWTAPVLAAAAVVAVVVGTVAVTSSTSSSSPRRIPVGSNLPDSMLPASTFTSPATASASTQAPSPLSSVPNQSAPPTAFARAACPFVDMPCSTKMSTYYVPIWPFTDYKQAEEWRATSTKTGSSPWHADAAATARYYVQNVLGFKDLDDFMPVSALATPNQAFVTVGHMPPSGLPSVFATLHLVRYGLDSDSPWEVVGTEDNPKYLTIDSPRYGSGYPSPVPVSGTFTGVDGNVVVQIMNQKGEWVTPVHSLAIGGEATVWQTEFSFDGTASASGVFVVVAFNGGAVTQHGPFAIQAFYH